MNNIGLLSPIEIHLKYTGLDMKHITITLGALAMATSVAHAGGIEREPTNVGFLFEKGRYAELNVRRVMPSVSGELIGAGIPSGDIAQSYTGASFALKTQLNDQLSFGLLLDEPVGANTRYPTGTGYPLGINTGTEAKLTSTAATALMRYTLPNNISVYGGPKLESIKGTVRVPLLAGVNYDMSTNNDQASGYLVGVAYEKPEIALRVALTYASAISHTFDVQETTGIGGSSTAPFTSDTPKSISLDFQSGVANDTLVFGSIRRREWSKFDITPALFKFLTTNAGNPSGSPLAEFTSDVVTLNIGIGRRFSQDWSGAVSLGYERSNGELTGNLNPVDGRTSIGLGGTYTKDNMKISAGVTYAWLGDAQSKRAGTAATPFGDFKNNHLTGFGVKVGFSF